MREAGNKRGREGGKEGGKEDKNKLLSPEKEPGVASLAMMHYMV